MKKITFLLAFVACAMFVNAQTELIVNGGMETWLDSKPTGWTLTTAGSQTFTVEPTIVKSGSSSLKSEHLGTSGTAKIVITNKLNVTAGETYTFSFWYYVASSTTNTETALRNWGYWNNPDGSQGTFDQLNLQMGDAASYILTNTKGQWIERTIDVTAPTGSGTVQLEIRFYKSATIYIDDVSFIRKTTGLSTTNESKLELIVSGKNLLVKNVVEGSAVEIFSAVGSKVLNAAVENGKVNIANLKSGMYVVRSGKLTQKIRL